MTPTELIRKALESLVEAVDDSYTDDSTTLKAVGYARAVLDLTEESK